MTKRGGAYLCVAVTLLTAISASAQFPTPPTHIEPVGAEQGVADLNAVELYALPALDVNVLAIEDEQRDLEGLAPRFAVPFAALVTPANDGTWENLGDGTMVWRLRIQSPGALSMNLGFSRYVMSPAGQMLIHSPSHSMVHRPFTAADNAAHGELWTPVVLGDEVVVEVRLPADEVALLELELTSINVGYRFFGEKREGLRSGTCNVDVICPDGDNWRDEIKSVAVISTGGSTFCTGFLVNNTALDRKNYFMTAYHCGITSGNAASLVAYWNFESPVCGQQSGGQLNQFNTGSIFRAGYSTSDFTLVELDDPINPAYDVAYAGWDKTGANATTAIAIHHPNTDEKSISFEYAATQTTTYLGTTVPGDGTHERVIDWDTGTTEPGSSGSPLFNQAHRVIGQLHGGYAACGNNDSDWYGKFSRSWTGGATNATRLSNWLDTAGTGATAVDTLLQNPRTGLKLTPGTGLTALGDPGGPFAPNSIVYTVENLGPGAINYTVSKSQNWVTLSSTGGSLAEGASTTVTVSINSAANFFGYGSYSDTVEFRNTTNGQGDADRPVTLVVGTPSVQYEWNMTTNPGWTLDSGWAWGDPTGSGGSASGGSGGPDPQNGHTGTNVIGYNLTGNYTNSLPERNVTTTVIDCTGITRVSLGFWRWLGVESSTWDQARVKVSTNGTTWTNVIYQNPTTSFYDTAWTYQEFDISAIADNQPTVYIRWSMGPTDSSVIYCGWNIDDVQIIGLRQSGTFCGADLDGDNDTDSQDLAVLLAAWESTPGGPTWNADADLDGDQSIGPQDLALLLAEFGCAP